MYREKKNLGYFIFRQVTESATLNFVYFLFISCGQQFQNNYVTYLERINTIKLLIIAVTLLMHFSNFIYFWKSAIGCFKIEHQSVTAFNGYEILHKIIINHHWSWTLIWPLIWREVKWGCDLATLIIKKAHAHA
jgi:hypothetical protein